MKIEINFANFTPFSFLLPGCDCCFCSSYTLVFFFFTIFEFCQMILMLALKMYIYFKNIYYKSSFPDGLEAEQFGFLGTISSVESSSTHKCCIFKNYFSILSLHTLAEVREKNPFCSFGWKFFGLQAFVCVCSCASFVGCRGGDQPLYISKSCSVGNLGHEIIHTLGLHHEHTRKDRDQYITVQWQNIMPGKHLSWL